MKQTLLEGKSIEVTLGSRLILENVDITLKENDLMMIVGPNGSGKTTLVRALLGQIRHKGQVSFLAQERQNYERSELARIVGVLTQSNIAEYAYQAEEVVALGRYAHRQGFFSDLNKTDRQAIDLAMQQTRTEHLKKRSITSLSGGEMQRINLAKVLAQEPQILILDEPTNHLDIEHQLEIFSIIKEWSKQPDHAVLAIVHDLNLVFAFASSSLLLHEGRVFATGKPDDVLSSHNLQGVYNVDLVSWMRNLLAHWQE